MKLPINYYSSQLNRLGFHDTNDFKTAVKPVHILMENNQGKTNWLALDNKCLSDINKALQNMENRTRGQK
jgi:hypothetical protein